MEPSHVFSRQKLGIFSILKEALAIPCKNTNLIVFTSLASLPLLCLLIFYEKILQRTLVGLLEILTTKPDSFTNYVTIMIHVFGRIVQGYSQELFQLGLLHVFPLHILKLFTAALTIDLASSAYKQKSSITLTTLRNSLSNLLSKERLKGIVLTSVCVMFLSASAFVASIWLLGMCYVIIRSLFYNMFSTAIYRASCMALLGKCMEWSVIWNMSIVVSVSEGIYGGDALMLSANFSNGYEKQGLLLMLIFFVLEHGFRFICLYAKWNKGNSGILAEVSMFCIGHVMKWVVCVVYYNNCKKQNLDKRVDVEIV